MKQSIFESKIKPFLQYVGSIGAVLMCIAYIVIVMILVFGLQVERSLQQTIVFSLVNAVVGLIIMQFLKIQGIDFAKNLEANQLVLKQWFELGNLNVKSGKRKFHSIKRFWFTSVIKDVIVKCITIMLTTVCIIYIIIEGSNDYTLLLLAVVNLIMFICFGLTALAKAYDYFNNMHIPFIKDKINEAIKRQMEIETHDSKDVEMATNTLTEQENDSSNADIRADILDTSVCSSDNCSNHGQCLVVNNNDGSDRVLGGTIYSSNGITSVTSSVNKEDY